MALGRAIVRKPKVFLFDEPLSNLDAKMRVQMRVEISRLSAQLQTTMIYVTHDQTEAMTMGHRIVCMKDGVIQQYGTPMELYKKPVNRFVAGFIGMPPMNFLPCAWNGDSLTVPGAGDTGLAQKGFQGRHPLADHFGGAARSTLRLAPRRARNGTQAWPPKWKWWSPWGRKPWCIAVRADTARWRGCIPIWPWVEGIM